MKKKRRVHHAPTQLMIKVTVINDRNATAAHVQLTQVIDGQLITDHATGSAKREPDDVRDDVIATNLAMGRALVKLGRRLQGTARILVADAAHRQEHEAIRRVTNRLRQVRPPARDPIRLSLLEIYQNRGLEAAQRAAARRGDEDLLESIVRSDLPDQHGRHEKAGP